MRRKKQKVKKETIHKYFTRQNLQNQGTGSDLPSDTATTPSTTTMAAQSEVSNAELRELIIGSQKKLDEKLEKGFANMTERMAQLTTKIESVELDVETIKTDQVADRKKCKPWRVKSAR